MKIKYQVINIDSIMFCQSTNLILTERARAACCCYGYHLSRRTQFLASVTLLWFVDFFSTLGVTETLFENALETN